MEDVCLIVILWPVRFLGKTVASQNIPISESINQLAVSSMTGVKSMAAAVLYLFATMVAL